MQCGAAKLHLCQTQIMPGKHLTISIGASATIIVAELLLVLLIAWVYAGMPWLNRDTGPATVTIQFAPPTHPPLARSHQI